HADAPDTDEMNALNLGEHENLNPGESRTLMIDHCAAETPSAQRKFGLAPCPPCSLWLRLSRRSRRLGGEELLCASQLHDHLHDFFDCLRVRQRFRRCGHTPQPA